MTFSPNVNDTIDINGSRYCFTEHPSAKSMPYGQTGRRATVYQLIAQDKSLHALKVFTQAYRSPRHAENADRLRPFASLLGLGVCDRTVITPQNEKKLIKATPDLAYAVVMPWVSGETWQEFMLSQRPLTIQQSRELSGSLASILVNMEQKGIAHCDLSGPNVMLPSLTSSDNNQTPQIALVDVDDLYAPNLPRPEKLPGGSPGYAHKTAPQGLWSAEADRFAAAVVLAEMLTWCDEGIRKQAIGEQFFDPAEIQKDGTRYTLMVETLRKLYEKPAAEAFQCAWQSDTLLDCPPLSRWAELLGVSQPPIISVVAPETGFVLPTFKPDFKPIDEVPSTREASIPTDSPPTAEEEASALSQRNTDSKVLIDSSKSETPSISKKTKSRLTSEAPTASRKPRSRSSKKAKSQSASWAWALTAIFGLAAAILGILYAVTYSQLDSAQWDLWNAWATVDTQKTQISEVQAQIWSARQRSLNTNVSGNGNWQEESLYLFSGDQIFVTITGQWCAWPSGCDFPDRLGVEYGGILNVPLGGLIGKIGNGSPFYLKTATTIQVNETGELYLRINDPDVSDNSGTISVRIEIK